jgi:hypothetical protein
MTLNPKVGVRVGQYQTVQTKSVQLGVVTKTSLADYSWGELKLLSRAIAETGSDTEWLAIAMAYHLVNKNGKLLGDEKPFRLNDGTKTSVRILGFRHDELADGVSAGISFEFADVPALHCMNSRRTNKDGWDKSEMRGWLNVEFLALLPDALAANIAEAKKRTNNKGKVSINDTSSVTATEDSLWLLSLSEVYGMPSAQTKKVLWLPATYDAEGAQYQLYADKGVSTDNYAPCAKGGACGWWLRSPRVGGSVSFRFVDDDGKWNVDRADIDWGISPGFCF